MIIDHDKHKGKISNLKLTSIKIHESLLDRSKMEFLRTKMNFQKVFNRTLDLYINDVEFRNKINTHNDLVPSGSL